MKKVFLFGIAFFILAGFESGLLTEMGAFSFANPKITGWHFVEEFAAGVGPDLSKHDLKIAFSVENIGAKETDFLATVTVFSENRVEFHSEQKIIDFFAGKNIEIVTPNHWTPKNAQNNSLSIKIFSADGKTLFEELSDSFSFQGRSDFLCVESFDEGTWGRC